MGTSQPQILLQTRDFIRECLRQDSSGHDFWHVERVWKMARHLSQCEGGNPFVVELGALLHDIADWKFHGGDGEEGVRKARAWLAKFSLENTIVEHVCSIIREVSFKGAKVKDQTQTLEAKIVQDADRLDAIGAIGIARTFAYGGFCGQPIYDPDVKPMLHDSAESYFKGKTHTINHFYEKLLLLKDRLHTNSAQKIAQERHEFMERFLERFQKEWNG